MEIYEALLYLLLFWVILYALSRVLALEKYGLEVDPFYLIYRTRRFNVVLDTITQRFRRFWLVAWNLAVLFAIGLMIYAIYTIASNLINFFYAPKKAGPVIPLVPLVTISAESLPYFTIAFAIVAVTHEAAHGIASRLEGVEIKSAGIMVFIALLGAFVEPNEEKLKKAKFTSRARIYAAGSSANLAIAVLALIVIVNFNGLTAPFYTSSGAMIARIAEDGPAYKVGLREQDVISAINGTSILSSDDYSSYMADVKPGEVVRLTVVYARNGSRGEVIVKTAVSPLNESRAAIKIEAFTHYVPKWSGLPQQAPFYLYLYTAWVWVLAVSVAIFNMLPIFPFDGDGFLAPVFERLGKAASSKLRAALAASLLGVLVANLVLTALKFGVYSL